MHAQRLINKLPACGFLVLTLVGCATSSPPTPPVTPARIPSPPVTLGPQHSQPMLPILEPLLVRLQSLLDNPPSSETSLPQK